MGFLKKMKAKLEDLKGFLKENKNKIGGLEDFLQFKEEWKAWKEHALIKPKSKIEIYSTLMLSRRS